MIAASILWLANGVWAFRDARRRGRSGVLVAILVLGTIHLGVLLWLVARPDICDDSEPKDGYADADAEIKQRANEGLL